MVMEALVEGRESVRREAEKVKWKGKLALERNKGKLMGSLKMDGCS